MRIIKAPFLMDAARDCPKAAAYLDTWRKIVQAATWHSLADVRRTYPSADAVRVRSGRQVLVFNVCGNAHRLIVAAHFDRQIIYTLRFLTHADYSKETWKTEL